MLSVYSSPNSFKYQITETNDSVQCRMLNNVLSSLQIQTKMIAFTMAQNNHKHLQNTFWYLSHNENVKLNGLSCSWMFGCINFVCFLPLVAWRWTRSAQNRLRKNNDHCIIHQDNELDIYCLYCIFPKSMVPIIQGL